MCQTWDVQGVPCTKIRGGRLAEPRDVQRMSKEKREVEWWNVCVSSMVVVWWEEAMVFGYAVRTVSG